MLIDFLLKLRKAGVPVSITEYLAMLDGLRHGLANECVDDFYQFARLALVKDERYFDRFDQVFADTIHGVQSRFPEPSGHIPADWLRHEAERLLSEEDKRKIQALGGFEELLDTLRKRLEEQESRHQGGSKWIGTGGTSAFGAQGYNPQGVRIGQQKSRHQRAVKVWDKREFKNLDDDRELGTRNLKMALRKLRRFAREGARDQFDITSTIDSTARNAGVLDIKMEAERRNAIKILLLFDVGGSMDYHVDICEELFTAARSEFKYLEYFYFHNFVYERLWTDNHRRQDSSISTHEFVRSYSQDYRLLFVGDASMSPYEIMSPGGSVEHWNEETGAIWMQRLLSAFPYAAWLNPEPEAYWTRVQSIRLVHDLMGERMYSLTVQGIGEAIEGLKHRH